MTELQQTLSELHRELSGARTLGPDERAMLEAALGDIQRALQADTQGTGDAETGRKAALEDAAVRLEAGHPGLANALRALVDALAKAGI